MNRQTSLLQRHLLTRSDLANLEVPATEVFRWLADGKLEQVGELPVGDDRDPVFTVLCAELRGELEGRLATLDKPMVVMTPLGVRSFLLRALLHQRSARTGPDDAALDAANTTEVEPEQARLVTTDELGDVLQDLAVHRIDDVQTVLQLAAEIAAAEAVVAEDMARKGELAGAAQPPAADAAPTTEDEPMANDPEPEELFDAPPPAAPEDAAAAATPEAEVAQKKSFVQIDYDYQPEDDRGDEQDDGIDEGFVAIELPDSEGELDAIGEDLLEDAAVEERAEARDVEVSVVEADVDALAEHVEAEAAVEASHVDDEARAEQADQDTVVDAGEEATVDKITDEAQLDAEVEAAVAVDDTSAATPEQEEDDADVVREEEAASAAQDAEVSLAPEPEQVDEPEPSVADEAQEYALTNAAMDRVQDFLGELRSALVEMAQRPAPAPQPLPAPEPAPVDVTPLVAAMQAGFERSASQASETTSALASLAQRMGEFGERVESGLVNGVRSLHKPHADTSGPVMAMVPTQTEFVANAGNRQALVLTAVAVLVVCWSILFWVKTGSPRLALGTLVGANAVGCCLLLARRNRS